MNANQVKALLVQNYLVPADFTSICFETCWPGFVSWTADILALGHKGLLVEVEVKVSISDLRADANKETKHQTLWAAMDGELNDLRPPPARIYYAMPIDLKREAVPIIRDQYSYAGLLLIDPKGSVKLGRGAKQLHNIVCSPSDNLYLARASARTIGRLLESNGRTR